MRFHLFVLMLFLLIISQKSPAQSVFKGRIFELNTRIAIPGTHVSNLSTKITALTDTAGRFAIKAKSGDLLVMQSFAYLPDTLLITNMKYREIYLQALPNMLGEVTVKQTEIRGVDFRDREYHGQTIVYQIDENSNHKGGVAFRLWYWNKDSKKVRRSQKRFKDEEILLEIDRVFNPFNIGKYIPLREQVLQDFINLYRPALDIYKSNGFNFFLYLNDSYKAFKQLPPEKRKLPPLKPFDPKF